MLGQRWGRNFTVTGDDLDFIVNTLLEEETPMTTRELATLLVEQRLQAQRDVLAEKYENTRIYNPKMQYAAGERVIFPQMELATATIEDVRAGNNDDYGDFEVITVEFDNADLNLPERQRAFATNLSTPHKLSEIDTDHPADAQSNETAEEIIEASDNVILRRVLDALKDHAALRRVAGYWFPSELVIEFDIGTLHLSEAVLDMNGGGPLSTEDIISQIGGAGDTPIQLQIFSLNLALNEDNRFSEVGPAGEVQWFLNRMMPEYVQETPIVLKYKPIEYNDDLLSDEVFDLETELDDEHTPIDFEGSLSKATTTLIYPHRRAGTLPLNAKNRAIFPVARTPRIHVELVDTSDGKTYSGWVVHEDRYVHGLLDYYTKHHLPVGAYITVERGDNPGQILLSYDEYKPRTEWVRILTPNNSQVVFENKKRAIGAGYDEFILIGVDDLEAVDKLAKANRSKSLAAILRELLIALGRLSPQGTVHAITLYSTVNVIRRCAPGPIFAILSANPDFDYVGNHYWKLSDNE